MPEVTISVALRSVGADGITFASIAVVSDIPLSGKDESYLNNYLTRVRLSVSLSVCGHGPDIAPFAITCGPNRGE